MEYIIYDFETKTEISCDFKCSSAKVSVPVIDIPIMSDETWNQLAHIEAVKRLVSIGLCACDQNLETYFDEIKKMANYHTCGIKPPLNDKAIFPLLSRVFYPLGKECSGGDQ